MQLREELLKVGFETKEADQIKDVFKGCIFMDATKGQVHMIEVIEMVLDMFEDVIMRGPQAKEPCINIKVILTDMSLHEDAIHRGPSQVYPAVREGIRGALMTANPVIFEPMQTHLIEMPADYIGAVSKLVNSKRGQMLDVAMEEIGTTIKAKLPVMEMIGWASDLRSCTEGKGVSSLVDQVFEKLPNELQGKVIGQIRSRKGLTEGQVETIMV